MLSSGIYSFTTGYSDRRKLVAVGWAVYYLGSSSSAEFYPVGAPIPWPSDTVPSGYALMQGRL